MRQNSPVPGSLPAVLDALEADHEFLAEVGDVVRARTPQGVEELEVLSDELYAARESVR